MNPDEEEESVVPRSRSRLYAESIAKGKSTAGALQHSENTKGGERGTRQYIGEGRHEKVDKSGTELENSQVEKGGTRERGKGRQYGVDLTSDLTFEVD